METKMDQTEKLLGSVAGDLKEVVKTQAVHATHIGLLIRCLYGVVAMVLLGVGNALLGVALK